eukprot:5827509-Pyramimonas_sp.AAC.1
MADHSFLRCRLGALLTNWRRVKGRELKLLACRLVETTDDGDTMLPRETARREKCVPAIVG